METGKYERLNESKQMNFVNFPLYVYSKLQFQPKILFPLSNFSTEFIIFHSVCLILSEFMLPLLVLHQHTENFYNSKLKAKWK